VKKFVLWVEWILLFIVAPVVVGLTIRSAPWLLVLGALTVCVAAWLSRRGNFSARSFWHSEDAEAERRQLKEVLKRFLICALVLVALTTVFFPEKLFALPRTMPLQWGLLLVTYPVLSVYPQELLYRAFFLKRYRSLFPSGQGLWIASALVFGWLHVIFRNPLAVALTLVGGWFFAQTYARTRSMRLVCLEHTLYGSLIFSVGLGEFFLQSALFR
jgi:membrane protease YdiL (CAAX protease family)